MLTTAEQLNRAENRLFDRWIHRTPTLLRDGALGGLDSTYLQQTVRVLFVLKEANDSAARWSSRGSDLREHTTEFASLRSTFPVLLLLASLAQSVTPGGTFPRSFEQTQAELRQLETRRQLLQSVVLLNLKKTPGGPVCDDRSLGTAVAQEGDLLRQQLRLYKPHLTIAGGASVFALLTRLYDTPTTTLPNRRPFFRHPALGLCLSFFRHPALGLCLSFFHPQATKGYRFLYDLLQQELLAHHFGAPTIKER